jgi:hypothetical protein
MTSYCQKRERLVNGFSIECQAQRWKIRFTGYGSDVYQHVGSLTEEGNKMNWVDLILLTILIGGLWRGMVQGFSRQLLSLLSLCLAGALAFLLYPDLAVLLRPILRGISRQGRELVSFLLVFISFCNLVNYAVRPGTHSPEERRREDYASENSLEAALERGLNRFVLAPLSMLGGLALACVVTSIWLGIAASIMRFSLTIPWPGYEGVRSFLYQGLAASSLLGVFDCSVDYVYSTPLISDVRGLIASLSSRFGQLPAIGRLILN